VTIADGGQTAGLQELGELTVAIYDDNDDEARGLEVDLGDLGIEGVIVPTEHKRLDDALNALRDAGNATVCDHVLRLQGQADFTGAELVVQLVSLQIPSVLITAFAADVGMEIRPHLPGIPAFLRRSELADPRRVLDELAGCHHELHHGRPRYRTSFRTPIYIERDLVINGVAGFDARVGSWRLDEVVRFPADMLGEPWVENPRSAVGQVFFAHANLAARKPEELFLEEVEPEPVDLEGETLHFE
jgi:hypothetical protein